jgi:hypothetical protein
MDTIRAVAFASACWILSSAAFAQFGIPQRSTKRKPDIATAPPITWVGTYAEAETLASERGRPIFVFFHDSLKGSRLMEVGSVYTPEVQKLAQRFVCVQVNAEEDRALAEKLEIDVSQGVLIADGEGTVLAQVPGNPHPEDIVAAMETAMKRFGPVPSDADLAAFDAMLKKAHRSLSSGRTAEALNILRRMAGTKAKCRTVIQARADIDELNARGKAQLAELEALIGAGKASAAATRLKHVAAEYVGTETGERAKEMLAKMRARGPAGDDGKRLAKRIEKLWTTANSAESRGRLDEESDALKMIVSITEGADKEKAQSRLDEIENAPELKAKREWQHQERLARSLLARGKMWLRTSPDRGKTILKELIDTYPEAPQAEEAVALLEAAGE